MLAFQGISKVAKATKTRIDLQAPAEQIAEWREEAEANGMDLSNWIRYALNKMRRLERAPLDLPTTNGEGLVLFGRWNKDQQQEKCLHGVSSI